eukprot:COSAG03_NODE_13001_length_522_cov_0.789598_2_plen_65_part_01
MPRRRCHCHVYQGKVAALLLIAALVRLVSCKRWPDVKLGLSCHRDETNRERPCAAAVAPDNHLEI